MDKNGYITEGRWSGHKKAPVPCDCGSDDLKAECFGSAYQIVCNTCDFCGPHTEDDGEDAVTDCVVLWNARHER